MYHRHVVLDLEFSPIPRSCSVARSIVKQEIIQIGGVVLDENYHRIADFSSMVKPEYIDHIAPHVTKLTGICDNDIENALSLRESLQVLGELIGDTSNIRVYS